MIGRVTARKLFPPSTHSHASALLGVACLGYTGRSVEVMATAVVPEKDDDR
jgi:hypothetical protein